MGDEGYLRLMQSVVAQALIDAVRAVPAKGATSHIEALRERDEARDWLTSNGSNFREIVSLAGLNPDDVRERSIKLQGEGWFRRVVRGRPLEPELLAA
jgi:hypothetical protein